MVEVLLFLNVLRGLLSAPIGAWGFFSHASLMTGETLCTILGSLGHIVVLGILWILGVGDGSNI